jgi:hypothetical protein
VLIGPCISGCIPGLASFSAREALYRFTIVAPERVKQGGVLTFHVEVTSADGNRAPEVTYGWMIDWPDIRGAMQVGKAFEPRSKEAKCSPGTAVLRIYAKNDSNRIVQVARKDFQVE